MPAFIIISSKKETDFNLDAKTVLESKKFQELHPGTYMGTSGSASTIATDLKNLESFKKNRSSASILIYHGSLSSS